MTYTTIAASSTLPDQPFTSISTLVHPYLWVWVCQAMPLDGMR
jgi:hypothetical protein